MSRSRKSDVFISIAGGALETIFDECDEYDIDETGGRLIGNYRQKGVRYDIQVLGIIPPGPNAKNELRQVFFRMGNTRRESLDRLKKATPASSISAIGTLTMSMVTPR